MRLENAKKNFEKALTALEKSVAAPITEARDLSGIIKDFEIVYELSWKTLKRHLEAQGHGTKPAKHTFATAYQLNLIDNEEVWLGTIEDRNQTVQIYDENLARDMVKRINGSYVCEFQKLRELFSPTKK